MIAAALVITALLEAVYIMQCSGHVALMEPPARNVLWRSGFPHLPKHEDDDYLLCMEQKGKRCPPCGDSPSTPKPLPHQAGGKWALGIIGRNYTAGDTIPVAVSVTNSHGGYMEFKLCPNNDINKPVSQRCLDQYPLQVAGHLDGYVPITAPYQSKQDIEVQVVLPKDVTCNQCVLQMSQYAEQFKPSKVMFRNCADIAIFSSSKSSQHSARPTSAAVDFSNKLVSSSNFESNQQRHKPFSSSSFPSNFETEFFSSPSHQPVFVDQASGLGGPSPFILVPNSKQSQTTFSQQFNTHSFNSQQPLAAVYLQSPKHQDSALLFETERKSLPDAHFSQKPEPTFFTIQEQPKQVQANFEPGFIFADAPVSQFPNSHLQNKRPPRTLFVATPVHIAPQPQQLLGIRPQQ